MIAKISTGSGFRGALDYIFKEDAETIGGNMAGDDPRSLAREFGITRALREDIEKPCYHISLALPKGEELDTKQWERIAGKYLSRMGIDPTEHQYILVQHKDTEFNHIHILTSRIALNGGVWKPEFDKMKSKDICRQIEKEHGLTTISNEKKQYQARTTQAERRMSVRTGRKPEKITVQEALNALLSEEKPLSHRDFIEALEKQNITAIPNVASTGRVSGYCFQYAGRSLTGSQVGYGWKHLQEFLAPPAPEETAWLQERKNLLQQGTPADAARSLRNACWEVGARGVPFSTALEKHGWVLDGETLRKNEHSYPLSVFVDPTALKKNLETLAAVSREKRETVQERCREIARGRHFQPRRSFMREMGNEDLLLTMALFPQAVLFLIALTIVAETARSVRQGVAEQALRAQMQEAWRTANSEIREEIKKMQEGIRYGRNHDSSTANIREFAATGGTPGTPHGGSIPGLLPVGGGTVGAAGAGAGAPDQPGSPRKAPEVAAEDDSPLHGGGVSGGFVFPVGGNGDTGSERPVVPTPTGIRAVATEAAGLMALAADLKIVTGADEMSSTGSLSKKTEAWAAQAAALGAQRYALKCIPRDEPGREKPRSPWLVERGQPLSVDEVSGYLKTLTVKNMQGYDVFVTPEDPRQHYLMVDDLSYSAVRKMQEDEFAPSAIWQTSSGSYQAVFVCEKNRTYSYTDPRRAAEEQALRELQRELTRTYCGDEKNLGLDKDFRLCGFANKKPDRNNFFTRIYEAPGGECPRLRELIEKKTASLTPAAVSEEVQRREAVIRGETVLVVDRTRIHKTSDAAFEAYLKALKKHRGLVKKMGWSSDPSALDFRVAVDMLAGGWHPDSVADAIRECSPDFPRNHGNPDAYLSKTIASAQAEIRSDDARRNAAPSTAGERGL